LSTLSPKVKLSVLLALGVASAVWGTVWWRAHHTSQVTIEGELRVGTLHCAEACQVELTLETDRGTRVRAEQCELPDALRDVPGVHVVAAGQRTDEGVLLASHLFVTSASPSSGRKGLPNGCAARKL
jgi:hypothetical protein